eukprot:m.83695 g.83695  ORF g.83695 m.83695 type:complete len:131 (-) comp16351_c0_seq9:3189-3581(-)
MIFVGRNAYFSCPRGSTSRLEPNITLGAMMENRWIGGKPVIGGRASLWGQGNGSDCTLMGVDALIDILKQQPKDPSVPGGYSLIPVHAWSHNVSDIAHIATTLQQLGGFHVVGANEFVDLVVTNHPETVE